MLLLESGVSAETIQKCTKEGKPFVQRDFKRL
jgi:hypothetical protein